MVSDQLTWVGFFCYQLVPDPQMCHWWRRFLWCSFTQRVRPQRVHAAPCSWTWSDSKTAVFLRRRGADGLQPLMVEILRQQRSTTHFWLGLIKSTVILTRENPLTPAVQRRSEWMKLRANRYLNSLITVCHLKWGWNIRTTLTFLRCTNLTFCGTHCRLDASNPQNYTPAQSLTAWCLPFSAAHSRTPVPHFIVLLWVMMNLSDAKLNHAGFLKLKELLRFGLWTEKGHLTAENRAVGRMWHVPMMCNFLDCWIQLKTASLKTSLSIFRDFLVKTQFYTLIMCNHCSPHFSFHPLTCVMCAGLTFLYKTQS